MVLAVNPRPLRSVWLLGLASLIGDVSGELLFAVLPFYVVAAGGAGVAIGLAGGLGDGIAEILKVVGGRWSDRLGRRRPFVLSGYALAAVGKLGIAAAAAWPVVVASRALERVGKGVRTAPRDSMVADSVPARQRGSAFGLHRTLDTTGAFLGVGLALLLAGILGVELRNIVLVAAAIGACALLPVFAVPDPRPTRAAAPAFRSALGGLPSAYRRFVAVAFLFGLAQVTLLFHILRAGDWFAPEQRPAGPILLYLGFNLVYAATAWPLGRLGDRIGRPRQLLLGFLVYGAASFGFARVETAWAGALVFGLLGVAYGLIESTERALAVDTAAQADRGVALGMYHTMVGLGSVGGGAAAGLLWDHVGPPAAFLWGVGVSAAAAIALVASGMLARPPPIVPTPAAVPPPQTLPGA